MFFYSISMFLRIFLVMFFYLGLIFIMSLSFNTFLSVYNFLLVMVLYNSCFFRLINKLCKCSSSSVQQYTTKTELQQSVKHFLNVLFADFNVTHILCCVPTFVYDLRFLRKIITLEFSFMYVSIFNGLIRTKIKFSILPHSAFLARHFDLVWIYTISYVFPAYDLKLFCDSTGGSDS